MQAQSGHATFERGGWKTEDFRRAARAPDAPVGEFQNPLDMFTLDLRQRGKTRRYRDRNSARQVNPERGTARQNHRPLDGVAQFAHVAGPRANQRGASTQQAAG